MTGRNGVELGQSQCGLPILQGGGWPIPKGPHCPLVTS